MKGQCCLKRGDVGISIAEGALGIGAYGKCGVVGKAPLVIGAKSKR